MTVKRDTNKLYELVDYLTGTATENPLPPGKTDNQLARRLCKILYEQNSDC